MAFWKRYPGGRVRVFTYKDNKQVSVPRKDSRHLDGQPDDVVQRYVDSLEAPKVPRRTTESLERLVEGWGEHLKRRERLNPATIRLKTRALRANVFPFFLEQDPPLTDPSHWPWRTVQLLDYLERRGLTPNSQQRATQALANFWEWLRDEGVVDANVAIRLRTPRGTKEPTPLKFALTPQQVLAWAATAKPDLAFMGLVGYFFSLRPQELFGVTKLDFRAGSAAAKLECCMVMARFGLYSRLAVDINKQYSVSLKLVNAEPKSESGGQVACFDEEAAKRIVEMVRNWPVTEPKGRARPMLPFSPGYNYRRWGRDGIPGVTLKDLRRASLYWLGHYGDIGQVALQSHARHTDPETTQLYLRRPEEKVPEDFELDLDA